MVAFIFHSTDQYNIVTFEKLFVKPEYRKMGVGTKIAELSVEDLRLRKRWPTVVRLIVSINNIHAVHMYRKYGLREVNAIKNYYGAGLHALAMQVVVSAADYRALLQQEGVQTSLSVTLLAHGGIEVCPVSFAADGSLHIHDCPFGSTLLSSEQDSSYQAVLQAKRQQNEARLSGPAVHHYWLLDAPDSDALLSPDDARLLLDHGHTVTVEMSLKYPRQLHTDDGYALEGCTLVPSHAYSRLPPSHPAILLVPSSFPLPTPVDRSILSALPLGSETESG